MNPSAGLVNVCYQDYSIKIDYAILVLINKSFNDSMVISINNLNIVTRR
tara:strand:- start:303 stop:449 length:147 start_codon:yes stop_codon:yes gene_type:complete